MREIKPLTSLRFLAALWVFAHHFFGYPYGTRAENVWQGIIIEGHVGVSIFFVLSGFLIALRYFVEPGQRRLSMGEYLVKRAARIFPLYYFILFATMIHSGIALDSQEALTHIGMVHGYFAVGGFTILPTAWSLTVEETFYLLMPVIFAVFWGIRRLPLVKKASPVVMLGLVLAGWIVGLGWLGLRLSEQALASGVSEPGFLYFPRTRMMYLTIFFRIAEFSAGIWMAFVYARYFRDRWWQKPVTLPLATVLCAVSFGAIGVLEYAMNQYGGVYDYTGQMFSYPIALFAGLLILGLTRPGTIIARALSHRLPVYLGRISYALYLIQLAPPVLQLATDVSSALNIHEPTESGFQPGWAAYYYLLTSVIAAVLYETVEKKGARLVMWLYRSRGLRFLQRQPT